MVFCRSRGIAPISLVEVDHVFHDKDTMVSAVLIHDIMLGTIAHARAV